MNIPADLPRLKGFRYPREVIAYAIRIFSSAENFRRVLRLISFTCLSADPFGPVFVLILYPSKDYDERKELL